MSKEVLELVRTQGNSAFRSITKELYLNHSGQKNKTDISNILKPYPDLLEHEILQVLMDSKFSSTQEKSGNKNMLALVADLIVLGQSSKIQDAVFESEASSYFKLGHTRVNFRAIPKALLRKSKDNEIKEIKEKKGAIISKLNELYLRQYAYLQKDSYELGFKNYLTLYELTQDHESSDLIEHAKEFIRDTEYISKDLLSWYLDKKMDIKLKNADSENLFYLINSFELKKALPKLNTHSLAKKILDKNKIELPAVIKFDTEKRGGHVLGSIPYIYEPGVEMIVSTNLLGSVFDYESFLEAFACCLSYSFTNRDDYFEYAHLRNNTLVETFSTLFKSLTLDPHWLRKHLRADADQDLLNFLYLRKLINTRTLAAKVIYEISLYQRQEDKTEMFTEIMETATHCKPKKENYLYAIQPHLSSLDKFKAEMIATNISSFLIENYDIEWWRDSKANESLINIWEQGGRLSAQDLCEKFEIYDVKANSLLKDFETLLG